MGTMRRLRRPASQGKIVMSEPREVEVLPCGYRAACLVPWCRRRATKVLRYLDTGRPYCQKGVCEATGESYASR